MIEKKLSVYCKVLDKIKSANNIALISHKNPDLDTIGSALGFYQIVNDNFFGKNIDLICIDEIPLKYRFLEDANLYKAEFDPENYDLVIFFDSGSKDQTGFDKKYEELFKKKKYNTLNIDHHITNEIYGRQNIINTTYSSTTMIVFEIFYFLKLYISSKAATSLLAGIYTDTGGFKHSNVSKNTFFVASYLTSLGGDFSITVNKFFKTNKLSKIKFWGKIISESFIDENNILYSYVNKTMIDSFGCNYEDINGVIDHLNTVEGIKYTTLLTQKGDYIKGSLRTLRDDIDLSKIAKKYDGGGHKKASGFTTEGKIESFHTLNFKV